MATRPDTDTGVGAALRAVEGVEGWLSDGQARMLWKGARGLEGAPLVVEIGSYHGRSTIVLARALNGDGRLVAIDPHAGNDRGPQQWDGAAADGQSDHERFFANLDAARVADAVEHVRLPSGDALGRVSGPIDLLYIDGSHRYSLALDDIRCWGERVRPGGELLIHDCFSSVGVTLALVRALFAGSQFRYLGRSGSLARYRRESLDPVARGRNALAQAAQLGWFARNLVIKLGVVLKLRPLVALMGQRDLHWPY